MIKDLVQRLQDKEKRMMRFEDIYMNILSYHFMKLRHPNILLIFIKIKECKVETNIGQNGVKVTIDSGKPGKRLLFEQILMRFPFKKILVYHLLLKRGSHACVWT